MTRKRTEKWGPSKFCKEGQHGWCANRSPEECHCGCDCHKPQATTPEADRLSQIRETLGTHFQGCNCDGCTDRRYLLSLVEQLQQERDGRMAEVEHWVTRYNELDAWRVEVAKQRNEAEATSARLRTALEQVLSHFPSDAILRELTPEGAEHVRHCPPDNTIRVADVDRWRAALAGDPTPAARGPDPRWREALQRIVDWSDCQCEHNDDNCCAHVADMDFHCPGCIAAAALGEPDGR